jgi:prepilin-type N-terminal cleavage/methylation domain-containing protein
MSLSEVRKIRGFSLVELTVVIVIIGILTALAMQSMTKAVEDTRTVVTRREMAMLGKAIVGDPELTAGGVRTDFGYFGDVGAFPPSLRELYQNTYGLGTWNGPYLPPRLVGDSTGFRTDEWGKPYGYAGGVTISSTGSGQTINCKFADATTDYLINTFRATIRDGADSLPGPVLKDSIDVRVIFPNGSGGLAANTCHPDSLGAFSLDSLPTGKHPLTIVFRPEADTLSRYVTVFPRHKGVQNFKFASAWFSSVGSGCDGSGMYVLRPEGVGTTTQLSTSGCAANWQCVDEASGDGDGTYVHSSGGTYRTDTYLLNDPPPSLCNVNCVTVYARAYKLTILITGYVKLVLRTHGSNYESSAKAVGSSYADYSQTWTTNPSTGLAWTWSEIADLEAGASLYTSSPFFAVNCTQVWVEVSYGP